jgi:ABC-type nitrate/sulfonate/bicarbonate transport system substrate-binding protein
VNELENLIRDIIELDKKKRLELESLEKEKSKIGSFLREKRQEIEKKYKKEADEIYAKRKAEMDKTIAQAEDDAKKHYDISMKEIKMVFEKNHQEWADSLYEYCIDFDKKDA